MTPGTKLGPYEILEPVGSGRMGKVYRAHDSRFWRDVAIKISAEQFTERFDREARAVAALNHPNICTLHDIGPNYLVMELLEGESPEGPLALDEAVRIMRQIANALDYAHEKGIIHRDLKPGNIKITPEGTVKVLDFGLAKIGVVPGSEASQDSPTLSMAATRAGVILGTAAYMSPEQARGKRVDKRTDIWSFGVVFYELLTGERLFKGEDNSEILAAVIKEEPRWELVPTEVRRLVRCCLQKDPGNRLRDMGDVWELLDKPTLGPTPLQTRKLKWLWPGIAALFVIVAGVSLWAPWRPAVPEQQPMRFEIYPPDKTSFAAQVDDPPVISPDGKRIAFLAMGQDGRIRIWIRELDSLDARRLDGTEEAVYAFWSPDSRWLAFQRGLELKKIAVSGGPVQTICACNPVLKGTWSTQGVIVFGTAQGMMKISEDGGPVTRLTSVDSAQGETTHLIPSLLPDQRHFTYYRDTKSRGANRGTYVGSIDAKPEQQSANRIFDGIAQYGSGWLLFVRAGVLMAQDFDVDRLSLKGEAIPITKVGQELAPRPEGQVLASGGVGSLAQLTWFDRQGKPLSTIGEPGFIFAPRISPDGSTVAFTRYDTGPGDIWLYEPKRGAYQFTFRMVTQNPIWSPDGSHIGFSADKIYQKSANGVGNEETLADRGLPGVPHDWSRDNKYFFFVDNNVKSKVDIWVLPLMGDKKAFPYLNADYNEDLPRLSPNGKWLAYEADKLNDRFEVYVDTFIGDASSATSASRGSWKVSTDGGTRPVWSRDGKELFFISADRKMMAVDVISSAGTEFKFTAPKPLFDARISGSPWDGFDISNDGRFLMPIPVQQGFSVPITVIVNWTEGLKK